ncbi:hypothetical protein [Neorhizobium vignae]|uniref:hypothetical protein n=1 Tax=Neorhizobium vignae TaxID=690585 RepID=UPI00068B65CE|nr:hypothetical protein [Neorhizobium vignae]
MTQVLEAAKVAGYQTSTVIARIMDMDVDAQGNGEKAAWKRYMGLALLAIAKSVDKKKLIEAVFGKGGKPSKTFQNMYSMADKARNTLLGNRSWDEIRAMPMDEAMSTVLLSINAHMSALEVSSKNDYDKVCNLSPAEAAAKREADKAAKAEADAAKAAEAEADKAKVTEAEADAQASAAQQPERTPAQAVIGALIDASRDDLMTVAAHILTRIGVEDMALMHETLTAMIANAAAAEAQPMAMAG